ncbi:MAG: ion channel [Pseudomonadota bacterium]
MSLTLQISLGTVVLTACAFIHVLVVWAAIPMIVWLTDRLQEPQPLRFPALLSFAIFAMVFAHMVQVWLWAAVLLAAGPFENFEASMYYSLITYTTVGYGDLVLGEGLRIFGAFASITGLLTFGISTAFLIGIIGHLIPGLDGKKRQ